MKPTTTPISDAAIEEDWPTYARRVHQRLVKGAETYGDGSFLTSPTSTINELLAEAEDLAGWGFIIWWKLWKMRERLKELEAGVAARSVNSGIL